MKPDNENGGARYTAPRKVMAMKRTFRILLAFALGLVSLPALAQDNTSGSDYLVIASDLDLDGEAADADQVVTVADLADSTSYAVAAQPDVCRLIDATVVDADSSVTAGTITITGTDCLGYTLVSVFTFTGAGSGVKTFAPAAYYRAITTVVTSALTGESAVPGTDTLTVGYTANSVNSWPMYGKLKNAGPNGEHAVDPFAYFEEPRRITTSGTQSQTVTAVSSNDAFDFVAVGDILTFNVAGRYYQARVTARASDDSITVHTPVTIPATGVSFRYKRPFYSANPADEMWIPVTGYKSAYFSWDVAANANTGGVVFLCECASRGPGWSTVEVQTIGTDTVATGTTGRGAYVIDLTLAPFEACRLGMRFGTGDDADAAPERIHASVTLNK